MILQMNDPLTPEEANSLRDLNAIQLRNLNGSLARLKKAFLPPDEITVSQWAAKKRRLSTESSAEPGPWRNERTPYLVDVMDAFTDPKVKHIVFVAASQVGKTECLDNIIGYIIDEDPGSILFVHPTVIDAKEFSKLRISPMLRDTPCLRDKIKDARQRDSGNTILQKAFPGGILTLCGSEQAHSLASKPIRYVLGDERDRWAVSAGTEGDPWLLAMARQTTFYNAKAVEVSTPTIKDSSAIAAAYETGTMERYKTLCPHCGKYHEITWDNISYANDEVEVKGKRTYVLKGVFYVCPECGCISDEKTMKHQPAKWEADNPAAYEHGTRSFWLNAFVSPWASWESIVLKYLQAVGDPMKMQVVYNTCFGLLWENRGDMMEEDELLQRREDYGAELPDGVLILTAGVDTQDDRMEYEVLGHGKAGETWGIERGVIMGRPDQEDTWQALDDRVFRRVFKFADGVGMRCSMSFVDEGGHFTQHVRQQCQRRMGRKVFCIKGMAGADRPLVSTPKQMKIVINKSYLGMCWQYQLGVDAGKTIIFDNLTVRNPGPRYYHIPDLDCYDRQWAQGLLSEHLIYDAKKKNPWVWEKLPGHERNEALDCNNYARAAFEAVPADLDKLEERLAKARGQKVERPESDQKAKPKPRAKQTQRKPRKLGYDSW